MYAYYSKLKVEFLDTYGSIVYHNKKIHCKTLMTIFLHFFLDILFHYKTFTHIINCKKKKSISKHWWSSFFLVILFHYKTFTHTLFNCKRNTLQNIDGYVFSIFPCQFNSITKHLHWDYLIVNNCKRNKLQNIDDYFFNFSLST